MQSLRLSRTVAMIFIAFLAVISGIATAAPASSASFREAGIYGYDGVTQVACGASASGCSSCVADPRVAVEGQVSSPLNSGCIAGFGVAANTGRFELTALGSSRYQTPAGLIYGPGSQHGHRLTHVLQHGFPDATKKTHSVFTSGSGALRTVDEAWLMRGAPDPSDLGKYVIPMGRTVGTGGETSVTVIVRPGTSQIITAYPSP